ncbi:hypothetical protein HDU82_003405 [Entophlyctis luteolus]|nr:hypothetical protein HDU82_003405 [Entophlyctis luteolus]
MSSTSTSTSSVCSAASDSSAFCNKLASGNAIVMCVSGNPVVLASCGSLECFAESGSPYCGDESASAATATSIISSNPASSQASSLGAVVSNGTEPYNFSQSSSNSDSAASINVGAIVGGIVGALFVLSCALGLYIWFRATKRRQHSNEKEFIEDFAIKTHPYNDHRLSGAQMSDL